MKSEDQIIKAHDMLKAIVLGEVPAIFTIEDIQPALDVLCWVLDHNHNRAFAHNLDTINVELGRKGYVLRQLPELN